MKPISTQWPNFLAFHVNTALGIQQYRIDTYKTPSGLQSIFTPLRFK